MVEPQKKNHYQQQLAHIKARYDNPYLNVAVIGDFSSGKSTYINGLIGSNLLKTAWTATTSVSTKIFHKVGTPTIVVKEKLGQSYHLEREHELLAFEKSYGMVLPSDLVERIAFLTTSNQFIDQFEMVELYVPSENLGKNVCILDTPGVNPGAEDTRKHICVTQNILREYADATMVLIPAHRAMAADFTKFLEENGQHFLKDTIFMITMMDLVEDDEQDDVVELVKHLLRTKFHLKNPLVYTCVAKYVTAKNVPPNHVPWVAKFKRDRKVITNYLSKNRNKIIHKQLEKLMVEMLQEMETEIHRAILRLKEQSEVLKKQSVARLRREIKQQGRCSKSTMETMKIGLQEQVSLAYAQHFKKMKEGILQDLAHCTLVSGLDGNSIERYTKKSLTPYIEQKQAQFYNKTIPKLLAPLIKENQSYLDFCNKKFREYHLGLSTIESQETTTDFTLEQTTVIGEDSFLQATSLATDGVVLVGAVATLAVGIPLALLDAVFDSNMFSSLSEGLDRFANWFKNSFTDIGTARNRVYVDICNKLNQMEQSTVEAVQASTMDTVASIMKQGTELVNKHYAHYDHVFQEKQRELQQKTAQTEQRMAKHQIVCEKIQGCLAMLKASVS